MTNDTGGPILSRPKVSKEDAYNAGYKAGLHGPNTENTHFSYFPSKDITKEWERGQRAGAEKRGREATHED